MPAKSKSPEAAQHKLWKAELKDLKANRHKVVKNFTALHFAACKEVRQAELAVAKAKKALDAAAVKRGRLMTKNEKAENAALRNFDRRIAILNGRLGL